MNTTQQETDVMLAFGQLGAALGALEVAAELAKDSDESGRLYQEYLDSLFDMISLSLESYIEFADATDPQLKEICECALIQARSNLKAEAGPDPVDDLLVKLKELVRSLKPSAPAEKTAA